MPPESATAQDGDLLLLSVHEIDDNPFQPRRDFSEPEIASLAESLKEHDMLQPVLVRRIGQRWQLISGERRLRAAIQAGWSQLPARVRQADDRLVAELAIVENLQRKDLNAIEKALSFRRYLEQHQCTQEDLGKRLKIDRSTIANLLRLLELPEQVQQEIQDGNDFRRTRAGPVAAGRRNRASGVQSSDSARGAERTRDGAAGAGTDRRRGRRPTEQCQSQIQAAQTGSLEPHRLARTATADYARHEGRHSPKRPRSRPTGDPFSQQRRIRTAAAADLGVGARKAATIRRLVHVRPPARGPPRDSATVRHAKCTHVHMNTNCQIVKRRIA